ncbi:hypothetical protein KXW00_005795 [Aspergillus fumigatus]|nr:hypothetical protein KXW00_005795 [Aspergillus fumigatus]
MRTPDDAVGRNMINASDEVEMIYTSNGDYEVDEDGDTIIRDAPPLGKDIVSRLNDGDPVGEHAVEAECEINHSNVNFSVLGKGDDTEAGREDGGMPGVGSGSRLDGGSLQMGLLVTIGLERMGMQTDMRLMGRLDQVRKGGRRRGVCGSLQVKWEESLRDEVILMESIVY